MAADWQCAPRLLEFGKNHFCAQETLEHPLKQQAVSVVDSKGTRGNARRLGSNASSLSLLAEQLTASFSLDGSDPLSQFARQEVELKDALTPLEKQSKSNKQQQSKDEIDSALNWSAKRLGILNRFTTSEKLSISTSFLSAAGAHGKELIKAQTVVSDKLKYRLEQLDNFEDASMQHMANLTQQEYIQRIEQLNQELVQSWHGGQRVKALKIAIQCSKMLADITVLQFYPSQFVLITDVLDSFGKLVHERLGVKFATGVEQDAAACAPVEDEALNENARETCQNWFYKIASVRELLPRLYLEMAILKCYEFLPENDFDFVLLRLSRMIRGIADPLISTYARCYLVRVGLTVTQKHDYIKDNFFDFLSIYTTAFNGPLHAELNRQRISMNSYLLLYSPALDFMLTALVHKTNLYTEQLLQKCKELKNNGPLLMCILNSFKSEFIAANALEFVRLLTSSSTEGVSKGQLFRALGSRISSNPPLKEHCLPFLNAAMQTINAFTDCAEYISCLETWAQFIAENFTIKEVNALLGDIQTYASLTQRKSYEKNYAQVQNILDKVLLYYKNIELLMAQENFLLYLDLFQKESHKIEVCKNILTAFQNNSREFTSDVVVINTLMYIGKILNGHVTALTVEDERRQISQLISSFIRKINFGRDFERQLSTYVEARANFGNLNAVYVTLVHAVNKLAMDTKQIMNNQHNGRTLAFVKACCAYCFITIPSIASVQQQMDLYLLSGQVALVNQCLGQADACFELALQLILQLQTNDKSKSMETYLISYLCNMLATLVVVPDSPEQGVLYLPRLLLDMTSKFNFETQSTGALEVYLHALDMLYVQSLEEFPYKIPNVVSNDELYGHDAKFINEVNNLCIQVIDYMLTQLKDLGLTQQHKLQAIYALELFLRIVRYADLSKEKTFQLAVNLWLLAKKHEKLLVDLKLLPRTLKSIKDMHKQYEAAGRKQNTQVLTQLLLRMCPTQ